MASPSTKSSNASGNSLKRLHLSYNPFEPSASGAPVGENLWLPELWKKSIDELLDTISDGEGSKLIILSGEYGSGKSYLLQWLFRQGFPLRHIQPYYFGNPGVRFYDLANALLRQIGRKDFAKRLWELVGAYAQPDEMQHSLFSDEHGFEAFLRRQAQKRGNKGWNEQILNQLQTGFINAGITEDEEIALKLARIIIETNVKPYFDITDFSSNKDSYTAEKEEAKYFGAILKTLQLTTGTKSVAFLIDEFEEISLEKDLTRRAAHDYLVTLRRLINYVQDYNLCVVLAMVPEAVERTRELEPALAERRADMGHDAFEIPPLTPQDANRLVAERLSVGRLKSASTPDDMFPFPVDFASHLQPVNFSTPRRLVKMCFRAISQASRDTNVTLPFTPAYLQDIEARVYPNKSMDEGDF